MNQQFINRAAAALLCVMLGVFVLVWRDSAPPRSPRRPQHQSPPQQTPPRDEEDGAEIYRFVFTDGNWIRMKWFEDRKCSRFLATSFPTGTLHSIGIDYREQQWEISFFYDPIDPFKKVRILSTSDGRWESNFSAINVARLLPEGAPLVVDASAGPRSWRW